MALINLQDITNAAGSAWNKVTGGQGVKGLLGPTGQQAANFALGPTAKGLIGLNAKSPTQNVTAPSNTISPQYVADAAKAAGGTLPGFQASTNYSLGGPNRAGGTTNTQNQTGNQKPLIQPILPTPPAPAQTTTPSPVTPTGPYTPQYNATIPPTVGSIASQEANVINSPSPQVKQAQDELAALKNEWAQKGVNINETAGFLTQAQGEQGLLNNQYLNALSAAETKLQNALTSQGQGITALGQAGQQVAPVTAAPGTSVYNPATGQFSPTLAGTQGGGGNLFGVGQLTQSAELGGQASQLSAAQRGAQGLSQQLDQLFSSRPDINTLFGLGSGAYTFTPATGAIQLGAKYVGDSGYQQFANLINDLTTRYAQILTPAGGNPTDARLAIAQSLINSNATPQSIQQTIKALDQQANTVISNLNPNSGGNSAFAPGTNGFFGG